MAESGPTGFAKPRYVTVRLPKTHRKFVVKLARVRKKYNTLSADTARVIVLLFSYLLLHVYTGFEQFRERGLDSDERIYGTRHPLRISRKSIRLTSILRESCRLVCVRLLLNRGRNDNSAALKEKLCVLSLPMFGNLVAITVQCSIVLAAPSDLEKMNSIDR